MDSVGRAQAGDVRAAGLADGPGRRRVPNAFEGGVISRFAEEVFPRLGLRAGVKPA
jgi:hypothetical protein